ncbi:CHAT domain-containing protein [Shimia aestuarii]|uniref:CHAT domain-containing protein n=1 Tax=Shimia aestuarii TaxID=254406 RepID=A0A1I4P943_9RHOB|nr:CHAT domain-containing protein [Shimia aestuarii]SFM24086.1 CHAT domain-containing protein [Shimia aestuarii]
MKKTIWAALSVFVLTTQGTVAASEPDPTGAVSADGVYTAPNVRELQGAFVGANADAADARIGQWIALKNAGQFRGLISATEADMRSDTPHPYAPHVWSWAQWKLGSLTPDTLPEIPMDLSETLGLASRAFAYEQADRDGLLVGLADDILARPSPDYWLDYEVAYAACSTDFLSLCRDIGRRLVEFFPNDFGAAYLVGDYAPGDPLGTMAWLDGRPELKETPAGRLILWMLSRPDDTAADRLALSEYWLEQASQDPNALRRLGYQQETLKYLDAALGSFRREEAVYPFRDAQERVGRVLAAQRRFDEVVRETRDWATSVEPEGAVLGRTARVLLRIYTHAGEYGLLREVAIKALETEPQDDLLRVLFGKALRQEGFPNEAVVTLAPVLEKTPTHYEAANQFMRALDAAGRPREVLDAVARYRAAGGLPNDGVLNYWHEALLDLEREEDLAEVHQIFKQELPEASWLQGNAAWALNKYGRADEALAEMQRIVMQDPASNWRIDRMGDYARATLGDSAARDLLAQFLGRYPYKKSGWQQLIKSGVPALEAWELAIKKNPRSGFAVVELARAMEKADPSNWRATQDRLRREIERLQSAGAPDSEVSLVYAERGSQIDDALLNNHAHDLSLIGPASADLDRARDLGIGLDEYWKYRYYLLSRAGASPELTFAALRRIDTHPDDRDSYAHLFTAAPAEHLGNDAQALIYFHRYLNRQPRSSKRLKEMALRHNKYGGSPVVALSLLDRAKRWDPDVDVDEETENAYGALGAHKRFFDTRYNRGTRVSNSLRYVNWFERARADTGNEQLTVKSLDFETMTVVQIRPDGLEWERRYHPVTGRLLGFRLGAVTGEVRYTEDGYLQAMQIGRNAAIELGYAPLGEEGLERLITSMRVADGSEFTMEYGQLGKPTKITVVGMGHLDITYDDSGEIASVNAVMDDGSESGFGLSSRINAAFGQLSTQARTLREVQLGDFSGLSADDPQLDALRAAQSDVWNAPDLAFSERVDADLALARALLEKVADHPDHMGEAERTLSEVFFGFSYMAAEGNISADDLPTAQRQVIEAVRLWRGLMIRTRPGGVPRDIWQVWGEMRDWVGTLSPQDPETIGALARLRAEMDQGGLRVLSDVGWLRKTHLTNPGFWRMHRTDEVFPRVLSERGVRLRDILVRRNGDVVVVSDKGFAVLRRGFWEWFGHDAQANRFSASADVSELSGSSNLSAVVEDEKGRLWLGGRSGLFMLEGDYDAPPRLWRSGEDGFPAGSVDALAINARAVAVGTNTGLAEVDIETLEHAMVESTPVERLRAHDGGWLAMGRDGMWWQSDDTRRTLTNFHVRDVLGDKWSERLFVLRGDTLLEAPWDNSATELLETRIVEGQETIEASDAPFGLTRVALDEHETALAVLTDRGGAVMGDGVFESFSQPGADRPVGIEKAHERDGRLYMITSQGVAGIVRGQATYATASRVHDLLSDPELGVTYVALEHGIDVVDHADDSAEAEYFSGVNARILELAPDGSLITHDDLTVLRFDRGSLSPRELFSAEQTGPDGPRYAEIQDILAASDGTIWAVAGASVFRWREGEDIREFSMFLNDPDYPVRSDMLYAIHEHADGRILLVASNEGHRTYRNRNMIGGLFELRGDQFVKADVDVLGSWFMRSLTRIDNDLSIAGTASGFARLRKGALDEYDRIEDSSYLALKDVQPALYLGTEGARLGKDLWLFGSAGGVVAYKAGTWFHADRLNWILPRADLANYGARTVHAIETDPRGRVYVGTDFGLTIYDPEGAGAESFLISEQRGDYAFSALEQDQMQKVNDILLDALPEDSEAGKVATAFRKSRKQIVALEEQLTQAQASGAPQASKIEKKLLKARQRDIAILARLERDQPALFNMLQLNPLDLRALGQRLPDDVMVAQYLPTDEALYINLVGAQGAVLKTVTLSKRDLEAQVKSVVGAMAAQARGQLRGFGTKVGKAASTEDAPRAAESLEDTAAAVATVETGAAALEAGLHWLYEALLRPIEHDVPDGTTLVVSPNGALAYLPFAALVREITEQGPQYAVSHFDLATAPSLYAVDMMIDAVPSAAFSHVVFGDPDGSLPHAREEAEQIAEILSEDIVELRIGEEATYEELLDYAGDARFVHLAMHGKLDHRSPKDSYLLLADNTRMSIPQIMTLPMQEAELVFLSACESGLGTDGLEYRTIAHAFAHAGAPAVIATLWQVDDAATRTLAESFYSSKMEGEGNAAALRAAQRGMIEAGGKHARPGYWAGMALFGKP